MTAVEWLFENLNIYVLSEDMKAEIKIFEQAKEMEKEQLKEAQVAFKCDSMGFKTLLENQFENWYKEKYKK